MKRYTIINTLAAVALTTFLTACANDAFFTFDNGEEQPVKKNISLTEAQQQMRDNNNDFACNLFRTIYEMNNKDSSMVLSPISVSYVLGMLNCGADGNTRAQITDVLGLGTSLQEINEYFKKMIDEAPVVDPKVTVKIANCIEANSAMDITLVPEYQDNMQKYYDAEIGSLDFSLSSSLNYINNWCNTHTNGMIPTILDELHQDAVAYLLNAVYFKATWTEKFDSKETRDMDFTKQDGTTVKRPIMHLKTNAVYGQNDLCKMLRLPYGSNGYSMYVLLPNEGKTVDDIIESISAETLKQQQTKQMTTCAVDILMPRFTTSDMTKLEAPLSALGMPQAFTPFAEFPNMAQGRNLYVSKMLQKAKIEVNEEGTKAAAVTVVETRTWSSSNPTVWKFHATRPFVYYIMEESTQSIFFMGTYCGD